MQLWLTVAVGRRRAWQNLSILILLQLKWWIKLSWQIATLQGLFVYTIAEIIAKKIFTAKDATDEKVNWM